MSEELIRQLVRECLNESALNENSTPAVDLSEREVEFLKSVRNREVVLRVLSVLKNNPSYSTATIKGVTSTGIVKITNTGSRAQRSAILPLFEQDPELGSKVSGFTRDKREEDKLTSITIDGQKIELYQGKPALNPDQDPSEAPIPGTYLSRCSEFATIEALSGTPQWDNAKSDSLSGFSNLSKEQQDLMKKMYDAYVQAAISVIGSLNLPSSDGASDGNEVNKGSQVDVYLMSGEEIVADVHVKLNDETRLIGFQATGADGKKVRITADKLEAGLAAEGTEGFPAAAKYKLARNDFLKEDGIMEALLSHPPAQQLPEEWKSFLPGQEVRRIDALARTFEPDVDAQGVQKVGKSGAKKGKNLTKSIELRMFNSGIPVEKGKYANKNMREAFIQFLDDNNIVDAIQQDLVKFLKEEKVPAYYFKYSSKPENVSIVSQSASVGVKVERITADPNLLTVEPIIEGTGTHLFTVSYDGQEIFTIETRTRGSQNHPPQLHASSEATGAAGGKLFQSLGIKDVVDGAEQAVQIKESVTRLKNEDLLREFIREALLTEAFTKTDEKAIEVMARKQIDKKWKEHEKKIDKMFDERDKTLFRNDAFYKVIARIYQELQRAYAEDQFKYATRYTRKDIPLARFRPS